MRAYTWQIIFKI